MRIRLQGAAVWLLASLALGTMPAPPAYALSEIQNPDVPASPEKSGTQEEDAAPDVVPAPVEDPEPALPETPQVQDPAGAPAPSEASEDLSVPIPGPLRSPGDAASPTGSDEDEAEPGDGGNDGGETVRPRTDPSVPLPPIEYDLTKLPEAVRKTHDLIIEAAKAGEIERLRPLLGVGDDATQISLGGVDGDPIAFLKELSGDGEGYEVLAILEEVIGAGYVHLDAGTPEELYVWPYFFAVPLDRLDGKQKVELFKLVTAGDYEDMKTYGAYIFYRVGITPAGRWAFFVAGD